MIKKAAKFFYYGLALDTFWRAGRTTGRHVGGLTAPLRAAKNVNDPTGVGGQSPGNVTIHQLRSRIFTLRTIEIPGYMLISAACAFYLSRVVTPPLDWLKIVYSVLGFLLALILFVSSVMLLSIKNRQLSERIKSIPADAIDVSPPDQDQNQPN